VLPHVILHNAISIEGRLDWSGPDIRLKLVHVEKARGDAVWLRYKMARQRGIGHCSLSQAVALRRFGRAR